MRWKQNSENKQIKKEIYHIIIPIVLESILETSAGLITTAMVGRLLSEDIAAQGICIRMMDLMMTFCKGVAIGATILIARAYGAGKEGKCRSILEQTLCAQMILAAVIMGIVLLRPESCLKFFTTDPRILELACAYIKIAVLGLPAIVVITLVAAAFQGYGNTKVPMYIAAVLNVVNVLCGYVMIFGAGAMKGRGIRGAAAALVIAQITAACIGLFALYGKKKGLFAKSIRPAGRPFPDRNCLYEVYSTGIPAALENMFWVFSAMILSKVVLFYGSASFAAYQLGIQAEAITEMPGYGFSTAASTLTAKAVGKKDEKLRQIYFREQRKIAVGISSITSLLLILLPMVFMKLMTDKPQLQEIGAVYVFIMGFVQIPQNLSRIYNGSIRAMGHKNASMVITGVGIWGIRIPLCILAAYVWKLPIISIWLIIAADQLCRFGMSVFWYRRINPEKAIRYPHPPPAEKR